MGGLSTGGYLKREGGGRMLLELGGGKITKEKSGGRCSMGMGHGTRDRMGLWEGRKLLKEYFF